MLVALQPRVLLAKLEQNLKPHHTTRQTLLTWRVASLARERDGSEATVASENRSLQSRRGTVTDNADCNDF